MAIPQGYRLNFETLLRASEHGALCLVECTDAATGQPAYAICAVNRDGDQFELAPLARLFDGNPYEELVPPMAETGEGHQAAGANPG